MTINNTYSRSNYFAEQYASNKVIRDLLIGLTALRNSKTVTAPTAFSEYIPKFPNEPDDFYRLRVSRTYLTNYFDRTLKSDSGKILANNVMTSIDGSDNNSVPEPINGWLADIDLQQKNFSMFARDQMFYGMAKGVTLAMADYHNANKRPFIREIDIDDVLSFKADKITSKLTELRFLIDIVDDSDEVSSYELTKSIYKLTPTSWSIESQDGTFIEGGEIVRYKDGSKRITDEIPVSVFYTNKKGLLKAQSPYMGLAELNIEHFQVYSDIKNMLFYALTPILVAKGVPSDFNLTTLASFLMVKLPESDTDQDLSWAQVDTGGIQEGQKQVESIERHISTFSIDTNSIRAGTLTATQASAESTGTNAAITMFATALSQHLENIVELMASYELKTYDSINVYVEPEFSKHESDKEMRILLESRRNRDISRKTLVDALVQRKLLPKDFNFELDEERLDEELEKMIKNLEAEKALKKESDKGAQTDEGALKGNGERELDDQSSTTA